MAMKFYMTPGSCSTGIHILLEMLELPFEAWILNLPAGDHLKPEYLTINPRGTIPTLVPDDEVHVLAKNNSDGPVDVNVSSCVPSCTASMDSRSPPREPE